MEAIVGRDAELGTIETWLTSATSPVLLLEGDAGIGKTTLWRATFQRGREHGLRILASIATEPESRLPYTGRGDIVGPLAGEVLEQLAPP